jgi:integrase
MLTVTQIRAAKPSERPRKLFDGQGLYLEMSPSGGKWWRFKYRYAGKEKRLSFGTFPEVSLIEAREKREEARKRLANDIDPGAHRKAAKLARVSAAANSFELVALEWVQVKGRDWSDKYKTKMDWILGKNLFPWIGPRPIADITSPELLAVLRRIESRGAYETAKRTKQVAGLIFRYAVSVGHAQGDPTQSLRESLMVAAVRHRAAVTEPKEVGTLLRVLDTYKGSPVVRAALQLAPLLFVRPGELRQARWEEIDLGAAEWRIPGSRMKMKQDHIVPLATQAIEILRELYPLTGQFEFVFPGARSPRRPMSDNAVLSAMRRMDIAKETMSGHGFRAMARTILDEVLGCRVDLIEHQLAHAVKDVNGRAYNRTSHIPERRKMMQQWADYLDGLRVGGEVIKLRARA